MLSTTRNRQVPNCNDFLVWRFVGQDDMDDYSSYYRLLDGNNLTNSGLSVVCTPAEIVHIRGILTGRLLRYEDAADVGLAFLAALSLTNAPTPSPASAVTRATIRTHSTTGTTYIMPVSISYTWKNLAADTEYTLLAYGQEMNSVHSGHMYGWSLQMDICRA